MNWPPSEMAESRACHSQKVVVKSLPPLNSPQFCHFLGVESSGQSHFRGWPGWPGHDCFVSSVFRQLGGGKKDGSPCVSQICPTYVLDMSTICLHPRERWDDFDCSRDQSNISLSPMLQPNYRTINQPHKYRAPSSFFISFDRLGDPVNLEFGNLAICVSRTHCSAFSTNLPSGWFYQGHRWSLINKSVALIKQI